MKSGSRGLAAIGLLITMSLSSGSASAGIWEVVYGLDDVTMNPLLGSQITTNSPGGLDSDPISGTITVHYDAISTGAPLSGARIVAGNSAVDISQPNNGLFNITGMTNNVFSPGTGGTPGVFGDGGDLGVNELLFSPIPDSSLTGFLHCFNGILNCTVAGFFGSVPAPQTPTTPGPFTVPFNKWVFDSGTAGVGDWTSPPVVMMTMINPMVTVTVSTSYVGREISRVFVPEAAATTSGAIALSVLAALRRRRSRRDLYCR